MEKETKRKVKAIDLGQYPAIVNQRAHSRVSKKYAVVPTMEVVEALGANGWLPVKAQEGKTTEGNTGYQKHLVRFQHPDIACLRGLYPEIVLVNSSDAKASFRLMAGLFRIVCTNGLVIADSMFAAHVIRHVGEAREGVEKIVEGMINTMPQIAGRVRAFREMILTEGDRTLYAELALMMRFSVSWEDRSSERLLEPVRKADEKPTLWHTYNVIQEKLVEGKFENSPQMTNVNKVVNFNRSLWGLTERIYRLKGGAS